MYSVVHEFKAINAISGHEREFKPGETVVSDSGCVMGQPHSRLINDSLS